MSMWIQVITFLLALPFGVWCLATFCALIDDDQYATTVAKLAFGVCIVLALGIWVDRAMIPPVLWAIATVTSLHVALQWWLRHLGTGAPTVADAPDSSTERSNT